MEDKSKKKIIIGIAVAAILFAILIGVAIIVLLCLRFLPSQQKKRQLSQNEKNLYELKPEDKDMAGFEEESAMEEESASSEESASQEESAPLEEYIAGLNLAIGHSYTGYLRNRSDEGYPVGESIVYDYHDLPDDLCLGYRIMDFDEDGEDELLTIDYDVEHNFRLNMYEVKDGDTVISDQVSMKEDYTEPSEFIFINCEGFGGCYIYDKTKILLYMDYYAWINADGNDWAYSAYKYNGSSFDRIDGSGYAGSGHESEDEFRSALNNIGVKDPEDEDLVFKEISEHLTGGNAMFEWYGSGEKSIALTRLRFTDKKDDRGHFVKDKSFDEKMNYRGGDP